MVTLFILIMALVMIALPLALTGKVAAVAANPVVIDYKGEFASYLKKMQNRMNAKNAAFIKRTNRRRSKNKAGLASRQLNRRLSDAKSSYRGAAARGAAYRSNSRIETATYVAEAEKPVSFFGDIEDYLKSTPVKAGIAMMAVAIVACFELGIDTAAVGMAVLPVLSSAGAADKSADETSATSEKTETVSVFEEFGVKSSKKSLADYKPEGLKGDQPLVWDKLVELVESKELRGLLVAGSAGTGKTYVMSEFVKALKDMGLAFAVTATTNQAVNVLKEKASSFMGRDQLKANFRTIQSEMGFKMSRDKNGKQSLTKDKYAESIDRDIIIVDECSMLDDFMFGRIKDKLEGDTTLKFVFVGDIKQLDPVDPNKKVSEPSKSFSMKNRVDMEKIVRQGSGNPIIDMSFEIAKGNFAAIKTVVNEKEEGVYCNPDLGKVVESCANFYKKNGDFSTLFVTFTNKAKDSINESLRKLITGNVGFPQKGDLMIADTPINTLRGNRLSLELETSARFKVISCFQGTYSGVTGKIPVHHMEIVTQYGEKKNIEIYFDEAANKAELEELARRANLPKDDRQYMKWSAFFEFQEKASWKAGFGWASTTHKAQGKTVERVYIHLSDMLTCHDLSQQKKLTYTAITRASKMAIFVASNRGTGTIQTADKTVVVPSAIRKAEEATAKVVTPTTNGTASKDVETAASKVNNTSKVTIPTSIGAGHSTASSVGTEVNSSKEVIMKNETTKETIKEAVVTSTSTASEVANIDLKANREAMKKTKSQAASEAIMRAVQEPRLNFLSKHLKVAAALMGWTRTILGNETDKVKIISSVFYSRKAGKYMKKGDAAVRQMAPTSIPGFSKTLCWMWGMRPAVIKMTIDKKPMTMSEMAAYLYVDEYMLFTQDDDGDFRTTKFAASIMHKCGVVNETPMFQIHSTLGIMGNKDIIVPMVTDALAATGKYSYQDLIPAYPGHIGAGDWNDIMLVVATKGSMTWSKFMSYIGYATKDLSEKDLQKIKDAFLRGGKEMYSLLLPGTIPFRLRVKLMAADAKNSYAGAGFMKDYMPTPKESKELLLRMFPAIFDEAGNYKGIDKSREFVVGKARSITRTDGVYTHPITGEVMEDADLFDFIMQIDELKWGDKSKYKDGDIIEMVCIYTKNEDIKQRDGYKLNLLAWIMGHFSGENLKYIERSFTYLFDRIAYSVLNVTDKILANIQRELAESKDGLTFSEHAGKYLAGAASAEEVIAFWRKIIMKGKSMKILQSNYASIIFTAKYFGKEVERGTFLASPELFEILNNKGLIDKIVTVIRYPLVSHQNFMGMKCVGIAEGLPGIMVVANPDDAAYIQGDSDDHVLILHTLVTDFRPTSESPMNVRKPEVDKCSDRIYLYFKGYVAQKSIGSTFNMLLECLAIYKDADLDPKPVFERFGSALDQFAQGIKKNYILPKLHELRAEKEAILERHQEKAGKFTKMAKIYLCRDNEIPEHIAMDIKTVYGKDVADSLAERTMLVPKADFLPEDADKFAKFAKAFVYNTEEYKSPVEWEYNLKRRISEKVGNTLQEIRNTLLDGTDAEAKAAESKLEKWLGAYYYVIRLMVTDLAAATKIDALSRNSAQSIAVVTFPGRLKIVNGLTILACRSIYEDLSGGLFDDNSTDPTDPTTPEPKNTKAEEMSNEKHIYNFYKSSTNELIKKGTQEVEWTKVEKWLAENAGYYVKRADKDTAKPEPKKAIYNFYKSSTNELVKEGTKEVVWTDVATWLKANPGYYARKQS